MGSLTLNRLWTAFRTEFRLLAGNWMYLSLHVLWAALVLMFLAMTIATAQGLLETTLGRTAIGLISLVSLFLAAISSSRSNRMKFHELEDSFPTGFEVIFGRWLAGLLALVVFLVEPIAFAATQGPLTSLLAELPTYLGEAGLTFAVASAFAWALMSWSRPGRWGLPASWRAGWLGFLLGPTILADRFPFASLLNFMRQGVSFYSELWGRLLYGDQPFWFNLFYIGLLLLFLAILMISLSSRRFYRSSLVGSVLLIIALTLAGWSGMRYGSGVQAAQISNTFETLSIETNSFTVTDYQLILDLKDAQPAHFTAELTAVNQSSDPLDTLPFRLNPVLTVTDASLPVERRNELVIVHLSQPVGPGETLSFSINYQGMLRVESISDGVVEASDFYRPTRCAA